MSSLWPAIRHSEILHINLKAIVLGDPTIGNNAAMTDVATSTYLNPENVTTYQKQTSEPNHFFHLHTAQQRSLTSITEATSSHQAEIVQELIALHDQGEEAHPGRFVVPSHNIPASIPEGQDSIMAYEIDGLTRYRSTSDFHDLEDHEQEGLAKLNIVRCGQFSKRAFEGIKESISNKKPFVFNLQPYQLADFHKAHDKGWPLSPKYSLKIRNIPELERLVKEAKAAGTCRKYHPLIEIYYHSSERPQKERG
ncbi:hypothetical protein Q9189_004004 [Teloschistes chrysophthalmus]